MRIDVLAGEVQFIDHLAPVYLAMPDEMRGDFIIVPGANSAYSEDGLIARAAKRKVLAVTEASDPTRPVLVTSRGDHSAARSMGRVRIARMEHGIGQSFVDSDHVSYAGGRDAEDIELFLTPNRHSADRWQDAYPAARVEVIGCPKLDDLPRALPVRRMYGPMPVIGVSFHFGHGAPKPGPLAETQGSFGEYRDAVAALARTVPVLGHGHPKQHDRWERLYGRMNVEYIPDFSDLIRRTNVYVCDTNSTIYEAATRMPVVVVNASHFRRDKVHGLRFDWGACTNVGVQCDSPDGLTAAVTEALLDRPEQKAKREAALDIAYAWRTGAAGRAVDALASWVGTRALAVA